MRAVAVSLVFATPLLALNASAALPDPLSVTYYGVDASEGSLASVCSTGFFNVINLGFVNHFGKTPFNLQMDAAGCSSQGSQSGCSTVAADIATCQKAGVKILISMGGATVYDCGAEGCQGDYSFTSDQNAIDTANLMYQTFFCDAACQANATSASTWRPFGNVVLDGIDLDCEMTAVGDGQSPQAHYDTFVNSFRALMPNAIVSAVPECKHGPCDNNNPQCNPLQQVIANASLDFLFVQYYNDGACGLNQYEFTAAVQYWVNVSNPNPNMRTLVGVVADAQGDSFLQTQYQSGSQLLQTVQGLRSQFPSKSIGVGVWEAATALEGSFDMAALANGLGVKPFSSATPTGRRRRALLH